MRVNSAASRPGRRDTGPTEGNGHAAAQGHVVTLHACADGTSQQAQEVLDSIQFHDSLLTFQSRCTLIFPVSKCGEPFENIATSNTGRVHEVFRVRQVTPYVSSCTTSTHFGWYVMESRSDMLKVTAVFKYEYIFVAYYLDSRPCDFKCYLTALLIANITQGL